MATSDKIFGFILVLAGVSIAVYYTIWQFLSLVSHPRISYLCLICKNVDTIACMAVNDVFVMDAWGKDRGVGDNVLMLADGNGEYATALGLELDATGFGMGMRGQRFAIVVDDGVATHVAVEAPGQFEVSKVEAVLEALS